MGVLCYQTVLNCKMLVGRWNTIGVFNLDCLKHCAGGKVGYVGREGQETKTM